MPIIKCEICESTDIIKANGVFICKNCGIQYSIEEVKKLIVNGSPNISQEDYVIKGGTLVKYRGKSSEIVIPEGVTNIGRDVFRMHHGITSVVIPNSTLSIDQCAFYGCNNLLKVIIGNSVKNIEDNAFYDCSSLREVIIPESVKKIKSRASGGCSSLREVIIPDSVIEIWSAFNGCSSLSNIVVNDFNKSYCSIDGVLFNKDITILIRCPEGKKIESYIIPDTVKFISDYAFCDCRNLKRIRMPNSIIEIGNSAFAGCSNLSNLSIPESVKRIWEWAFPSNVNLFGNANVIRHYNQ